MIDFKSPSEALNRSYWSAVLGGEVISTGFHLDKIVLDEEQDGSHVWRFSHRWIYHHWTKDGGYISNTVAQFRDA